MEDETITALFQVRSEQAVAALEELEGCLASFTTVEGEVSAKELSRLLDGFHQTFPDAGEAEKILKKGGLCRMSWEDISDGVGGISSRYVQKTEEYGPGRGEVAFPGGRPSKLRPCCAC